MPVAFAAQLGDLTDEGDVVRFPQSIQVTGSLVNAGGYFVFAGRAEGTVELLCDRCMEPFEFPFETDMQYSFIDAGEFRRRVAHIDQEVESDASSDTREFVGDEIDLTNEVREAVLLAIPSKRLCSSGCKGICPVCGANRNTSECKCAEDSVDPRLADLASLYRHMGGGETVGKSKG